MHRSGTSVLARSLNLLGLRLPRNLLAANEFNELGYWEPRPIVHFNDELLAAFDRNWADPKPMAEGWHETQRARRAVPEASALLKSEFADGSDIVVKDPRMSRVFRVWREAFIDWSGNEPRCLICCRNPLEVYRSLAFRDGLTLEHSLRLWLTYLLEAELGTRGLPRAVVHYEDFLTDWREALRSAFAFMGLPAPASDDNRGRDVDDYVSQGHRHHTSTAQDVSAHSEVFDLVKAAYELLRRDTGLAQRTEFDQLRRRWQSDWQSTSPGAASSTFAQMVPEWHLEKSKELEKERHIDDALSACCKAIALRPDSAALHHRKGNLLLKVGRLAEAAAAQRQAIALNDRPAWFHGALGNVLARQGRTEKAIEALDQALERGPQIAHLHHRKGNLLLKVGRLEDAEAAQRQAIALDDSPAWFHRTLGEVLERQGRIDEAVEAVERALQRGPQIAHLHHRKGSLLLKVGRLEEAEAAQRQAIALDGGSAWFYEALGEVLERMGRTGEAIEALEHAVERGPEIAWLHHLKGVFLARAGRLEDAFTAHRKARALGGSSMAPEKGAGAGPDAVAFKAASRDLSWSLAMAGAERWADDIKDLLPDGDGGPHGEREWPLGRLQPSRIVPPVQAPPLTGGKPLLSIVIPVYNVHNEDWLRRCIESVLIQDRGPEWADIVIVDDASSHDTARRVAEGYGSRIKYRRNDANLGLIANHNHCLNISAGKFIHFLHQDDFIEPEFYDKLVEPMLHDDCLVASYANHRFVNQRGQSVARQALERRSPGPLRNWIAKLAQKQVIQFSSIIVRRSAYQAAGGFSPSLVYAFDWEMWGRVVNSGPVWYEPSCIANMRTHRHSATHGIAPLDRLVDEMRCVFHMIALLPADVRYAIARAAFMHLLPKYWTMVARRPQNVIGAEHKRLSEFLVRSLAGTAHAGLILHQAGPANADGSGHADPMAQRSAEAGGQQEKVRGAKSA